MEKHVSQEYRKKFPTKRVTIAASYFEGQGVSFILKNETQTCYLSYNVAM